MTLQRWTVPANYIIGPAHASDEGAWVLFTDAQAAIAAAEARGYARGVEDAAKAANAVAYAARSKKRGFIERHQWVYAEREDERANGAGMVAAEIAKLVERAENTASRDGRTDNAAAE